MAAVSQQPPAGYGPDMPSPARIHNRWQGGSAHYEADRAVAARIEAVLPQIRQMAKDSQLFAARITGYAAAEGVRQFIALGRGLEPGPGVHEIARSILPAAVCAYVGSDPYVTGELGDRFWDDRGVAVVDADPCDPAAVLASRGLREVIDPGRPVCVLASAVPHYLPPARARRAMAAYGRRVVPGSFLAACVPQIPGDLLWRRLAGLYTPARVYRYTPDLLGRLLAGLVLVPPGITTAGGFRPGWGDAPEVPEGPCVIAAAGRKPGCLPGCACPCGGRGLCGLCGLAGCPPGGQPQPPPQLTVTGWSGWPGEEMTTVHDPGSAEAGTDSSRS